MHRAKYENGGAQLLLMLWSTLTVTGAERKLRHDSVAQRGAVP